MRGGRASLCTGRERAVPFGSLIHGARTWRLAGAALALGLSVIQPAWGQQPIAGSIAGRVTDESGAPLPGAAVIVTTLQGSTSHITDGRGRFLAPHLTPGTYSIRVQLERFRPVERSGVEVQAGGRVELSFTLSIGSFTDAIEIKAAAPIVDFSTSGANTTLDSAFLSRVPVGRGLGEIVYLAAGVSSAGGTGAPNPSISGASGLENEYDVDGVRINEPRHGTLGVFSEDYGALGSGVTYDFIAEVQTTTSGGEAEYAQSTGGVVNVLTKSGTNELHGSAFAYLRPEALEGTRRQLSLTEGAVNTVGAQRWDAGLTLGGPILRDRAFFFMAVDPQEVRTTLIAPEGFPLRALGGVARTRRTTPYAAKATFALGKDHRLDASVFGDPSESGNGPQSRATMLFGTRSAFSGLSFGSDIQTLQYQGILSPAWLVEGSVGRARVRFEESPSVDQWQVTDETTKPSTSSGGVGSYEQRSEGSSWQYQVKSTNLFGDHELRYGASFESAHSELVSAYTGPAFTLASGERTMTGALVTVLSDPTFGRIYRVTRSRLQALRQADQRSLGIFVQDKVAVGSRLTITAGLRYERQQLEGTDASFTFADNWAPRLGLVLDPTGTGRMKAFASVGVFFARIPSDLALTAFNALGRVVRADYFDPGLTRPVPEGVDAGGTTTHLLLQGASPATIDPTAKLTYIREAAIGFEFEAADQLNVGVRYVHRDMPRVLEDVGTAAMILYFTHDPAFSSVEYMITNPRNGYPATVDGIGSFQDPIHRYDAVELTVDKRFSANWMLLASYRWSRLWGTYEGFYDNSTNQAKPAESSLLDFPTNDPTFTAIGGPQYGFRGDIRYQGDLGAGPLPNDSPHQLKVYGAYAPGRGLTLGAGLTAAAGRPLTPMATDAVNNRQGSIPEAPRGSGIETEDGFRTRTPFVWSLDLHADYVLPLRPGRVRLAVDVLNVFNTQAVISYDQNSQRKFGVTNPDFGRRTAYQEPRQVRVGLRFEM
jgi:hypothetical protein